jgi:hypothetical protein
VFVMHRARVRVPPTSGRKASGSVAVTETLAVSVSGPGKPNRIRCRQPSEALAEFLKPSRKPQTGQNADFAGTLVRGLRHVTVAESHLVLNEALHRQLSSKYRWARRLAHFKEESTAPSMSLPQTTVHNPRYRESTPTLSIGRTFRDKTISRSFPSNLEGSRDSVPHDMKFGCSRLRAIY